MKKYLFLTLCLSIFLFPFIGNAKTITKADLETEAESLINYAHEQGLTSDMSIDVTDTRITIDMNNGETTYEYEYTINDESTVLTMISEVQNGMTKAEFEKATGYFTGAIFPHIMISHINGVSYDDAFAYYLNSMISNISLSKKGYIIPAEGVEVEPSENMLVVQEAEFPNRITELAEWMYSNGEYNDSNEIYTYSSNVATSGDASTITYRLLYRANAIYSNMDGAAASWDGDIDENLPIDFSDKTKSSPKTSTNVKVPNTALSINNFIYVLGLITILAGLLSVNKVIKRKSN